MASSACQSRQKGATPLERLLTQAEASELLRLSERTLERQRVAGTGARFVRLGKSIRYRERDLVAWVEARVVGSTSEKETA
jgi:excisionase family DNA binding protein